MSEISLVHTTCKSCVFALFDKNSQIGCAANYLDRYRNKNEQILEAFDDDKEFYIINNKKCLGFRQNSWFEKLNMADATVQEKLDQLNKENLLQYLLIIDLKTFTVDDVDRLEDQLKSITIKTSKVIFIRYDNDDTHTYERLDSLFKNSDLRSQWRIQSMLDESLSYDNILHTSICIENKFRFIVSLYKPYDNLNSFIDKVQKIVFEELDQFNVITDKDKCCFVFSGGIYRYSMLNEHKDILKDLSNHTII